MANTLEEKDFVNILWEYLQVHYSQRMQMLNFFIVLETVLCTGLITVLQLDIPVFKLILSFATIFFAVIFMLIDIRAKHMIKFAEKSYQTIESKYGIIYGKDLMVITTEQEETNKIKKKHRLYWFISYSKLVICIYIFFILLGIAGIICSFVL